LRRRPAEYWYHDFIEGGTLEEKQALFEQEFKFKVTDKQRVDAVIIDAFKEHNRYYNRYEDPTVVPIPSAVVLALMLRKGFGRAQSQKVTLRYNVQLSRRHLEYLLYRTSVLATDPKFLAGKGRNLDPQGLIEAAAAEAVSMDDPHRTDVEVFEICQTILDKEFTRQRSRAKKKPK
jgi:hypothetical protein